MVANDTLNFLKQQLIQVDAQIAPLEKMREVLQRQIDEIESDDELAAHGLKRGDAVALTIELVSYNRMQNWEITTLPEKTLYIQSMNFEQVVLSKYSNGGGLAYGAPFEVVLRAKEMHEAIGTTASASTP